VYRRSIDEGKGWLGFGNIVSSELAKGPTPPSGGGGARDDRMTR
jgi:hypothetical protein